MATQRRRLASCRLPPPAQTPNPFPSGRPACRAPLPVMCARPPRLRAAARCAAAAACTNPNGRGQPPSLARPARERAADERAPRARVPPPPPLPPWVKEPPRHECVLPGLNIQGPGAGAGLTRPCQPAACGAPAGQGGRGFAQIWGRAHPPYCASRGAARAQLHAEPSAACGRCSRDRRGRGNGAPQHRASTPVRPPPAARPRACSAGQYTTCMMMKDCFTVHT